MTCTKRAQRMADMDSLRGTWRLFRLQLRLDRFKLPLWMTLTTVLIYVTLKELCAAYGSEERVILYASTTAPSTITRVLGGALTGPSIGEITIIESFLLIALMVCLVNIFLVVRHTRKNEEAGRTEIIGSLIVGRQAQLTSTLLLASTVNIVFVFGFIAAYRANNLPMEGALVYSVSIGLMGMFFACVAAVAAQLFENSRSVNGFAAIVLAVSWLFRGIGDALGTLDETGLGVESGFLSYLSPLGWVTNTKPFSGDERLWLLGLFGVGILALTIAAYGLSTLRDVGGSTFQSKSGRANASRMLLSRMGLVWRLNRAAFVSWLAAMVVLGATMGAVADEFKNLIANNEEIRQMLAAMGMGGVSDATDILFAATFSMSSLALAGYGLQILSRIQSEESSGRLELILSTRLSRFGWIIRYVIFAAVSSMVLLFVSGLSTGLAYGLVAGDVWANSIRLSGAIMVNVPAILVMLGFSVVLFGVLPRLYTPLTWSSLGACLIIYQLGPVLNLPRWLVNVSPFAHTPPVPADSINFVPLCIMTTVALGLLTVGLMFYRNRDLVTE